MLVERMVTNKIPMEKSNSGSNDAEEFETTSPTFVDARWAAAASAWAAAPASCDARSLSAASVFSSAWAAAYLSSARRLTEIAAIKSLRPSASAVDLPTTSSKRVKTSREAGCGLMSHCRSESPRSISRELAAGRWFSSVMTVLASSAVECSKVDRTPSESCQPTFLLWAANRSKAA